MNAELLRDILLAETNVLLYGPPATGKTHLVQQLVSLLDKENSESGILLDSTREHGFLKKFPDLQFKIFWVTFHQSYSYDNFVIGLRPDTESEKLLALKPEPGVLLQAAANASLPGHASLMVIDEVNRGNVGQVFGDFITIMEADKRLSDDGSPNPSTVFVNLPYVSASDHLRVDLGQDNVELLSPFAMPRRLYTLATMNSIDKSAAPLDAAIRRRFRVLSLNVDQAAIAGALGIPSESMQGDNANLESIEGVRVLAGLVLSEVNKGIEWFLGNEFQLGQWYLAPLALVDDTEEAVEVLATIWGGRIWPQLEDLFALRPEQLSIVLNVSESTTGGALRLAAPPASVVELGASPTIRFNSSSTAREVGQALLNVVSRRT